MLKFIMLMFCAVIIARLYKKNRLVSSTSMWVFCYMLIFIVYPLYTDIKYEYAELIDILALIGIIIFGLGILFASKIKIKKDKDNGESNKHILEKLQPNYKISLIFFCIFAIISILALIKVVGIDRMKLIISGRMTSKQLSLGDLDSSPITFSMHLLVPCILSMWITSKTRKQKIISIIALLIYVIETILFGFTRIFLITIIAMIFFYEIRNTPRKKQILIVCIVLVSLILGLVFMNFTRSLGLNSDLNFKDYLTIDFIFESTDFSASYKFFDELIGAESPYISPIVYLKPLFSVIPRSIWEDKPEPLSMQVLKYLDPALADTGFSTAGNSVLGEGYAVLGYFGMFLFCFIWGIVCEFIDSRYYNRIRNGNNSCLANIYYYIFAVFIIVSAQRGDWSQYMTLWRDLGGKIVIK